VLTISSLQGKKVFVVKKAHGKAAKNPNPTAPGLKAGERYGKLGKIHMAVFSDDGRSLVGFLVKRPDAAGVVKRDDVFLAYDAFAPYEKGVRVIRGDDAFDEKARERLGIADKWDSCIMWAGMDAVTQSGRELGYVGDAEFDESTGKVTKFLVGDGGMANALVGSLEIPPAMLIGYSKGRMVVSDKASDLELNGGLAAKAGEATAKAKIRGQEFGQKAGKATSEAVDKGSFALGKAIGGAKKAIREAQEDDANSDESSDKPAVEKSAGEPASYAFGKMLGNAKRAVREAQEEDEQKKSDERAAMQPQMPPVEAEAVQVSEPVPELSQKSDSKAQKKTYVAKSEASAATPAKKGSKKGEAPAKKPASSEKKATSSAPSSKSASTKKKSASGKKQNNQGDLGKQAARAFGVGLSRMNQALSGFKEEYDKNSK
jgi:uncharacterized protein YrrD